MRKYLNPMIIFVLVVIGFCTGFLIAYAYKTHCLSQNVIPSIEQFQERLGVEADGIVGPKTINAWEREYNNQSCRKALKGMAR